VKQGGTKVARRNDGSPKGARRRGYDQAVRPKNPRLYRAARKFQVAAEKLFASPDAYQFSARYRDLGWRRQEGHHAFILQETGQALLTTTGAQRLLALPEAAAFRDELEKDPVASRWLGKMVQHGTWASRFGDVDDHLPGLVELIIKKQCTFDQAYAQWEDNLRTDEERGVVLWFLGFVRYEGRLPIDLGGGLSLRQLTEEEMGRGLEWGMVPAVMSRAAIVQDNELCVACEFTSPRQEYVGADTVLNEAMTQRQAHVEEGAARVRRLMSAIQLFRPGGARITGQLMIDAGAQSPGARPGPRWFVQPVVLEEDELSRVIALWHMLEGEEVEAAGSLQAALRRFGYAFERTSDEDRIVDLMIAAESWFVDTSTDLGFRLQVNAARFMAPARPPRQTQEFMKHAYNVRSKIVHGEPLPKKDLVTEAGQQVSEHEFALALEGFVREALLKALRLVAGGKWTGEWLDVTLGKKPPTQPV
jgi:Apea-like HEPN